jgi:hypothetical protein
LKKPFLTLCSNILFCKLQLQMRSLQALNESS